MRYFFIFFLSAVIGFSCKTSNRTKAPKAVGEVLPNFLTNYTVNPAPNGLDSVGIIFSVDSKGATTTIANLNLRISSDSVSVPQEVSASNLSFKFLIDFLAIKNIDSTARVDLQDTVRLNTNFRVNTGILSRFDPDVNLFSAFNSKRENLVSNIKFLGLQKNKLYLIVEAIKSNEVDLSNIRNSNFTFDAEGKFKELIKINPGVKLTKIKNNSLTYTTASARVIFYKLRSIDIENIKGPEPGQFSVSIGEEIQYKTLY